MNLLYIDFTPFLVKNVGFPHSIIFTIQIELQLTYPCNTKDHSMPKLNPVPKAYCLKRVAYCCQHLGNN